jgi:hypothetical protein
MPGDPVRKTANATQQRRIAKILNDLQGVGCRVEKPTDGDGRGWKIIIDGSSDIEYPPNMQFPGGAASSGSARWRATIIDAGTRQIKIEDGTWTRLGTPWDYTSNAPDITLPATDDTYYIYAELTYSGDPTTDATVDPTPIGITVDYSDVWPTQASGATEASYKRHLLATVDVVGGAAQTLVRRWTGDIPDFPFYVSIISANGANVNGDVNGFGLWIMFDDVITNPGHGFNVQVSDSGGDHLIIRPGQGSGEVNIANDSSIASTADIKAGGIFKQGANNGYTGNVTISGTTLQINGGIITGVT